MENKQTAVEWLVKEISKDRVGRAIVTTFFKEFEQAKQIEKEHIKNAYDSGCTGEVFELNCNESSETYYANNYDTTKGLPEEDSKRRGWHY